MSDLRSPWYTLPEAQEILELKDSEITYAIQEKTLLAHLKTAPRKMMAVTRTESGKLIGHATFSYNGHLTTHSNHVVKLIEEEQLKKSFFFNLSEKENVDLWNTGYPYKSELPNGALLDWQPMSHEEFLSTPKHSIPMPKEFIPLTKGLAEAVEKMMDAHGTKLPAETHEYYSKAKSQPLSFDFKDQSKLIVTDIRVSRTEIERFRTPSLSPTGLKPSPPLASFEPESSHQLKGLITKILREYPTIKTLDIWKIIETDSKNEDPIFDQDNILGCVDADCIEWTSRHGKGQSMKWSTFQAQVSRIRGALNKAP